MSDKGNRNGQGSLSNRKRTLKQIQAHHNSTANGAFGLRAVFVSLPALHMGAAAGCHYSASHPNAVLSCGAGQQFSQGYSLGIHELLPWLWVPQGYPHLKAPYLLGEAAAYAKLNLVYALY